MARLLCTAPTRSPAWLTSFWSTSSAGWRSAAVTVTQTWERLTTWVSGRHGSRPAREMIRPRLWSLPISGSVRVAFSAATETSLVTPFTSPGEEAIFAALHLAAFSFFLQNSRSAGSYRGFFSDLAVHRYLA